MGKPVGSQGRDEENVTSSDWSVPQGKLSYSRRNNLDSIAVSVFVDIFFDSDKY